MNISIVVPVHNEAPSIRKLYDGIINSVAGSLYVKNTELIFIDDGSDDNTESVLAEIQDKRVKSLLIKERQGQSAAMKEGFRLAQYDVIATIDGDLQFEPKDIIIMANELSRGYDCICGYRFHRVDSVVKRITSRTANFIRRIILGDEFMDIGCPLRVFRRKCIEDIPFFDGYHRFLPFLIQKKGYNVKELKVTHKPRVFGKSKYNSWNRLIPSVKGLLIVRKQTSK